MMSPPLSRPLLAEDQSEAAHFVQWRLERSATLPRAAGRRRCHLYTTLCQPNTSRCPFRDFKQPVHYEDLAVRRPSIYRSLLRLFTT